MSMASANDWQCPNSQCQNHTKMVFGSKATCPKCGTARGAFGGGAHYQPLQQMQQFFGDTGDMGNDWACPNSTCINAIKMVFGKNSSCPKCGTPKGAGGHETQAFSGNHGDDWACPNMSCVNATKMVFGKRSSCPKCGTAKGGASVGEPADDWACPNSTCLNATKMVFGRRSSCPACASARDYKTPGDWLCPNTVCVNSRNTVFASKIQCTKCGTMRPGSHVVGPTGAKGGKGMMGGMMGGGMGKGMGKMGMMKGGMMKGGMGGFGKGMMMGGGMGGCMGGCMGGSPMMNMSSSGEGDWKCPNTDCMNNKRMVFGKHESCPQCGTEKSLAAAGHGGKGGHGANDWQCPNDDCVNARNKVFGRHSECPKCGTANPNDRRARSRSPRSGIFA